MKLLLIGILICLSGSAFGKTLNCFSKDWDPNTITGQGLQITFDESGKVTKVYKLPGSWFCDDKTVENPKVIASDSSMTVYDLNFNCDEYNGRLITFAGSNHVTYQFSYPDDEKNRESKDVMACKD